jgi:hypothetical protein
VVLVAWVALVFTYGCHRHSAPTSASDASPQPDSSPQPDASVLRDLGSPVETPPSAPILVLESAPDADVVSSATVWSTELEHRLTGLHFMPAGDILAISSQQLTVFDRRGRLRWYRNLAPGDTVIPSGRCIYVRTADQLLLTALDERGGIRWEREVEGTFYPLGDGSLLATDAAAVRSLECRRGRERWMFSPDRQRSLRLLEVNDEGLLLMGELGTHRLLFSLSLDGELRATRELPHSTQEAQVAGSGWMLARTANTLTAINEAGHSLWTQPVTARTEVVRYQGNIVLANGSPEGRIEVRVLGRDGEASQTYRFDAGAEPVSMGLLASDEVPLLVAACTGALRSCAERGLSAGPYNRLWGCRTDGAVTSLIGEREESYFEIAQRGQSTMVVSTTSSGQNTKVIHIDRSLHATTLARLNGRRMLGPVSGPQNTWLVSTCQGHRCEQPWRLYAIADQTDR